MKKRTKILACIAFMFIAIFALTGAGCEKTSTTDASLMEMSQYVSFRVIEQGTDANNNKYQILVDDDEGVLYYYQINLYRAALSPLVHADGTPKLLQEYDDTYTPKNG